MSPGQAVNREANSINRGFGREKLIFATMVYKSEIDMATLKDWVEMRVQLIADYITPHFRRFLTAMIRSLFLYLCGDLSF